jgi:hypothetical protein
MAVLGLARAGASLPKSLATGVRCESGRRRAGDVDSNDGRRGTIRLGHINGISTLAYGFADKDQKSKLTD